MNFMNLLKNIFFFLLFLQLAPALLMGVKKQFSRYVEQKTSVAIVEIKGILTNSNDYNKQLHKYFSDPEIKAILIKMECPGGASGTSAAIFNEIRELKKEHPKPIVTLVENLCASGGYYIASATDRIIAPQAAIVGSIGAAMNYMFKLRDFVEQFKIHYTPITAGDFKCMTDPFCDLTPEQRALLQGVVSDTYEQFTQDVAQQRNLVLNQAPNWANGKIFTARQALKLGLVDEIGSASTAVKAIKELALIDGEIEWIKQDEPHGLLRMFGGSHQDDHDGSMFGEFMNALCDTVEHRYLAPRAAY